jgi:hypothetical protein
MFRVQVVSLKTDPLFFYLAMQAAGFKWKNPVVI